MIQTQAQHKTTYRARTQRKSAHHTCAKFKHSPHTRRTCPPSSIRSGGGEGRGAQSDYTYLGAHHRHRVHARHSTHSRTYKLRWGEIESRRRVAKSRTDVCAWADGHRKHIAGLRRQPRRVHPSNAMKNTIAPTSGADLRAGAGRLIDSECLTRRHATLARAHTTISLPCAKRLVPWSRVRAIGPPPSSPRDRRARK